MTKTMNDCPDSQWTDSNWPRGWALHDSTATSNRMAEAQKWGKVDRRERMLTHEELDKLARNSDTPGKEH